MFKIFLLLIGFLGLFFVFFVLNNTKKVHMGLGLILLTILLNLNIRIYNGNGQIVYISLTTLITLIAVTCIFFYSLLLRKEVQVQTYYQRRLFALIFSSLLIIMFIILLQSFFCNIYDTNLYTYHLTVYLTLSLFLVWFFISSKLRKFQQSNIIIFKLSILISIINFLISILQYVFNKSFLLSNPTADINYYEGVEVVKRVWGIVGASNGAGNLGAILFPVLLFYFYKTKSKLALFSFSLNILFVLLTLTRIAYLAIIVQLIIFYGYLIFRNINYKNLSIRIFILLFGILFISISIYLFYEDAYKLLILDRGNTESGRFEQFNTALIIIKKYPLLGVGAGQYVNNLYSYFGIKDIVVHSQFLNIFVETGLFSFILFFSIYIYMFINILKKFPRDRWFPISLFLGNFITTNFNPNQYYTINVFIFFFIVFGLLFYNNSIFEVDN